MNLNRKTVAAALVLAIVAVSNSAEAQPLHTLAPVGLINRGGTLVPFAMPGVAVGPANALRPQVAPLQLQKFTPPCRLVGTPYLQTRCL